MNKLSAWSGYGQFRLVSGFGWWLAAAGSWTAAYQAWEGGEALGGPELQIRARGWRPTATAHSEPWQQRQIIVEASSGRRRGGSPQTSR